LGELRTFFPKNQQETYKQAALWWKLSSPTKLEEGKLANHNLPVGMEKELPSLPKKSCFLLLTPGCVFQTHVL
jgi:hypothetical protein